MLFITKYALTKGIVAVDDDKGTPVADFRIAVGGKVYTIGHSIFNGLEAAIEDATMRRDQKVAELQALTFPVVKGDE